MENVTIRSKSAIFIGVLSLFALFWIYQVFAARRATVTCDPRPVAPAIAWVTSANHGRSFPPRINFPVQERPLVVMTYNIAGHDELVRSDHIARIAAVINQVRPDIVGLQEVHRWTWQSRFHDQFAELERRTGMHGFFGRSLQKGRGEFGNAILTRGEIVSAVVYPLAGSGEPRTLIESVLRIDG